MVLALAAHWHDHGLRGLDLFPGGISPVRLENGSGNFWGKSPLNPFNKAKKIMQKSKEQCRQEWQGEAPVEGSGKSAEVLRRLTTYRQCRQLFVSPAPFLAQIRINALLDGKELIMPGPSLKEGFYRLRPFVLPFAKLRLAVSLQGLPMHGQLLRHPDLATLAIGLLVTEALAVDSQGRRLGDGSGYFDLACAVLKQSGALAEGAMVLAAGVAKRPETLPVDPWDVRMHGLLDPQGAVFFAHEAPLPGIDWQQLPMPRIKKMTPFWKEWERAHPGTGHGEKGKEVKEGWTPSA